MITLYGVTEDGVSVPVQVTEDGKLVVLNSGIQPGQDIDVGDINASGLVDVGDPFGPDTANGCELSPSGGVFTQAVDGNRIAFSAYDQATEKFKVTHKGDITSAGRITAAGDIDLGDQKYQGAGNGGMYLGQQNAGGILVIYKSSDSGGAGDNNAFLRGLSGSSNTAGKTEKVRIAADGSADFAGNKCGFTSEGDLVFTSRGDRFRIVVQQGICYADPFPLKKQISEKLEREQKPGTTDIVLPDE